MVTSTPYVEAELVSRIRDAWGLKRAGGRITDAVNRAIDASRRSGRVRLDDDFLSVPGSQPMVRDRSEAKSSTLRRPEALPPSELRVALIDVVDQNFGATEEQLVLSVSRAVGF